MTEALTVAFNNWDAERSVYDQLRTQFGTDSPEVQSYMRTMTRSSVVQARVRHGAQAGLDEAKTFIGQYCADPMAEIPDPDPAGTTGTYGYQPPPQPDSTGYSTDPAVTDQPTAYPSESNPGTD